MESKKINQLATELTPALDDLTIIGDPTTGVSKKITLSQMASLFTGTVEECANFAAFPLVGVADTIYIALDTNVLYRWNTGTSAYVELSPNIINSLVFSDANGFDGNISLVGSVATLTITTALTQGSVPFIGTSGALTQDNANLFFDDTNNRLGINTNAPTTALDVFGSGIIGRLNGTSTNNAFLGFASAGTNKWSIGNVQSDHRFRIYSEANTAELVSVLQTGEFGIGIANPTTKLHIDGGASALIANLDANVSVAKSVSFRSDNSNRFNLEVSGTESGSNAGMDFFLRRYSDAGALIDTPLTITRSTGIVAISSKLLIGTNTSTIGTALEVVGDIYASNKIYGVNGTAANPSIRFFLGASGLYSTTGDDLGISTNGVSRLTISSTGAIALAGALSGTSATFSSGIIATGTNLNPSLKLTNTTATTGVDWHLYSLNNGNFGIYNNTAGAYALQILSTGQIGIGTAPNSSFLLDIYQSATSSTAYARIKNNRNRNAALQLETNLGNFLLGVGIGADTNQFQIYDNTAGANRLVIGSTGNAEFSGQIKTTYSGQSISINAAGTGSVRMQLQNNSIGNSGVCVESSTGGDQFSGTSAYSMAIGTFTARDFYIGTNSVARVTVNSSGNFGIGVPSFTSTNERLVVRAASTTSSDWGLVVQNSSGLDLLLVRADGLTLTGTRTNSPYNLPITTGRTAYLFSDGSLGYQSSVRASKTNIENINDTSWLLNLNPVSFNKRFRDEEGNYTDEFWQDLDYGLIAEEAELVNSNICFYDETEEGRIIRGVSYEKLITPMLKLIQELEGRIKQLES